MILWMMTLLMGRAQALPPKPQSPAPVASRKAATYRERVRKIDEENREVLAQLYKINQHIKDLSKTRQKLNEEMQSSSGDAKALAFSVDEWRKKITDERSQLQHRLSLLYRMNSPNLLPFLFSSDSANDFDRNIHYLKSITDEDFRLIEEYKHSLAEAKSTRRRLKSRVAELIHWRRQLKQQEQRVAREQAQKAQILKKLRGRRESNLLALKEIRKQIGLTAGPSNRAFFEKRGVLPDPVQGTLTQSYGATFDKVFRFRLFHKGWTFVVKPGSRVRAISSARVAFAGILPGYGKTVILDHGDNYYSVYAWNRALSVKRGDLVENEASVAESGAELYFEIRHFSDAVDPSAWIKDSKSEVAQRSQHEL